MNITKRIGDHLSVLAKPRFVQTDTPEFKETLECFVMNNVRTEKRRHGHRTEDQIRANSERGLVAEFCFKQIAGVEDSAPVVLDIRNVEYEKLAVDQIFAGYKFQVKSKTLDSKWWTFNQSQHRSILHSQAYNDFYLIVGCKKESEHRWLAVPQLLIDAKRLMHDVQASSYNTWMHYYDHQQARHNRDCIQLTKILKQDSIQDNNQEQEMING